MSFSLGKYSQEQIYVFLVNDPPQIKSLDKCDELPNGCNSHKEQDLSVKCS
jgi:hypothetical protein